MTDIMFWERERERIMLYTCENKIKFNTYKTQKVKCLNVIIFFQCLNDIRLFYGHRKKVTDPKYAPLNEIKSVLKKTIKS